MTLSDTNGSSHIENEQNAWDAICVNPHEQFVMQGRQEGRDAGLLAGYTDGRQMGRVTAMDYGMELGFFRGVIRAMQQQNGSDRHERAWKTQNELTELLDRFPGPTDMFQSKIQSARITQSKGHASGIDHIEALDEGSGEQNENPIDVLSAIQRIRARFKLFTTQLGMPNFSLRQAMDAMEKRGDSSKVEKEKEIGLDW
jgi:hypothetical protein